MNVTTSLRQNKKSIKLSDPKKGFEKEIIEETGDHTPENFQWWAKTYEGNFAHHKGDSIDYYTPNGVYLSSDDDDWWGTFDKDGCIPPSFCPIEAKIKTQNKNRNRKKYIRKILKHFLYKKGLSPFLILKRFSPLIYIDRDGWGKIKKSTSKRGVVFCENVAREFHELIVKTEARIEPLRNAIDKKTLYCKKRVEKYLSSKILDLDIEHLANIKLAYANLIDVKSNFRKYCCHGYSSFDKEDFISAIQWMDRTESFIEGLYEIGIYDAE